MSHIHQILQEHWGYSSFRPLQEEIIESVLDKKDTLALLPTGGGKSICYQVPALANEGLCLVVSPLIALMKDQVENLRQKGIMALAIYSGMSRRLMVQTLKNAAYGNYKILYVSPERLETNLFKEYLPALGVNLIAVDEAHCISQWGYDFRPSYLKIIELRKEIPHVPVLALTASATENVQKDICEKLGFPSQYIFRQSYQRSNLSYSVFKAESKLARLTEIVNKVPGSAIIYCQSRKRTVEIANLLQMHGHAAQFYHAGLPAADRDQRQQAWVENKVKIMVCTNAFGMGIDKPDVRLVLHADVPDCLENYYQEAGRAGRDGKKAYAVLLYDEKDITTLKELPDVRFPVMDKIRQVYHALVNYLQMPSYTGEDRSYTFHFAEFIRNFKLQGTESLYALKALESDGWIYFNEKNFTPSTVVFTTTREQLMDFQQSHTELENILTSLLRTYDGIFDYPAFISEIVLAQLLRTEAWQVKKQLQQAAAFHIIEYKPQSDEPQIIFKKHRVPSQELTMNYAAYKQRKEHFAARVAKITAYATTKDCRSRFINEYFGERTPACGVCDNCLNKKARELDPKEFASIAAQIHSCLATKKISAQELLAALHTNKEKAWSVINFLQAENKIGVDTEGRLFINSSSAPA